MFRAFGQKIFIILLYLIKFIPKYKVNRSSILRYVTRFIIQMFYKHSICTDFIQMGSMYIVPKFKTTIRYCVLFQK